MEPKKDWYEFKSFKKRSYDSQVWVPLRASIVKESEGKSGHVGFREEYLGVGTMAVPIKYEAIMRATDSQEIRDQNIGCPYVNDAGQYIRADEAVAFCNEVDGVRLVIGQSIPGLGHREWHLNQDFALALNLVREGDVWVRVEEGRTLVVQLERDGDGSPKSLAVRVEFLKDYLSARKMGLVVGIFSSRTIVQQHDSDMPWARPTAFDEDTNAGWRWRGDITAIHAGSPYQYGSEMQVFSMSRTDYDPEDEAPTLEVGGEFESDSWTVPLGSGGEKVFRISGEIWKTEWISPADASPRVAGDTLPSTAYFNVGGAGARVSADDLPTGLVWLWFRQEIVADWQRNRNFEGVAASRI
jgi:hypothetical protein